MIWLLDDQHLSHTLRGSPPPEPVEAGDDLATTGLWYFRLCRAALRADGRLGALSRPLATLPDRERRRALTAVLALPDTIGLVSLRALAPTMGDARTRHDLNALATEALAAALHLDAAVLLSRRSPRLEGALAAEGQRCVVS